MNIKRYGLNGQCDGESGRCLEDLVRDAEGDYVLYEDHVAIISELEAELVQAKLQIARYKEADQ